VIDCFKFGIISKEELEILRSVQIIYGRVNSIIPHVSSPSKSFGNYVLQIGGKEFVADAVVSALGPDSLEYLNKKMYIDKHYYNKNKELLLDSIDDDNHIMYICNNHGEAATGASLEGLLAASFINNKITNSDILAINRVKLMLPSIIRGCLFQGLVDNFKDDGIVREYYINQLLGFPKQYIFRLLDKNTRIKLLSL
jgi:hypothetical protein